jgi:hypothetical protein
MSIQQQYQDLKIQPTCDFVKEYLFVKNKISVKVIVEKIAEIY